MFAKSSTAVTFDLGRDSTGVLILRSRCGRFVIHERKPNGSLLYDIRKEKFYEFTHDSLAIQKAMTKAADINALDQMKN